MANENRVPGRAEQRRIRLLLVDSFTLFRKCLASLFSSQEGFQVVGEASEGPEALKKVKELSPDVVLMQTRGGWAIKISRGIRSEMPGAKVVLLCESERESEFLEAVKAGALGYIPLSVEPAELFRLTTGVARGEAAISPTLTAKLVMAFAGELRPPVDLTLPEPPLTRREKEVLTLVAEGMTNKEIARKLGLNERTVKNHVHHVLQRLDLRNRTELSVYATRRLMSSGKSPYTEDKRTG